MGDADLSELQILVETTFVPMTVAAGVSKDPRELVREMGRAAFRA